MSAEAISSICSDQFHIRVLRVSPDESGQAVAFYFYVSSWFGFVAHDLNRGLGTITIQNNVMSAEVISPMK